MTGSASPSQPASLSPRNRANAFDYSPGQTGMGQYDYPIGPLPASQGGGMANAAYYQNFRPNPLASAQSLANTFYGPQQQILADQLARQQSQLGMVGVDAQYRTGALNRDNALAQRSLGLDRQALGVDRSQTQGQLANLDKLKGILKQQYGLNDRGLANTLKQLGIDKAGMIDQADRKIFDLRSDLTARGAYNTVANERGTGRVARDLMYGLGGIGTQTEAARLSAQGNRLGLDEKGIGLENQAAGLQAKLAGIGIDTARLGISGEQLANSLEDGLYQIGLGSQVSINGLLDAIGGTNAQQAQLASTILQQVAGYASLPPEVLAQLNAAVGAGAGGQASSRPRQGSPRNRT